MHFFDFMLFLLSTNLKNVHEELVKLYKTASSGLCTGLSPMVCYLGHAIVADCIVPGLCALRFKSIGLSSVFPSSAQEFDVVRVYRVFWQGVMRCITCSGDAWVPKFTIAKVRHCCPVHCRALIS
jgi:hypothetical protein